MSIEAFKKKHGHRWKSFWINQASKIQKSDQLVFNINLQIYHLSLFYAEWFLVKALNWYTARLIWVSDIYHGDHFGFEFGRLVGRFMLQVNFVLNISFAYSWSRVLISFWFWKESSRFILPEKLNFHSVRYPWTCMLERILGDWDLRFFLMNMISLR